MESKRAILLLPGSVDFPKFSERFKHWLRDEYLLIAVDGGIDKAEYFPKKPDLWIGDFDSATAAELKEYGALKQLRFPSEKDEVDSELGLNRAIAAGCSEVVILGGIGGRLDHQMALMFLPFQYQGLDFIHTDGEVELYNISPGKWRMVEAQVGATLSFIPLEPINGLTLTGVKWPLDNFTLPVGKGLTFSNVATERAIKAFTKAGRGWLYYTAPGIDLSL